MNWCYDFSKWVLRLLFRAGYGLEISGHEQVPRRGAFILASNHVSFLDPPLIGAVCPRRLGFMARSSLYRHWLLGAYLRGVRAIPIHRDEADIMAIRAALARLRGGDPIAIFPEGTRQVSGRLSAAKRGVGFLAETAQVPVIPVLVTGTFAALPPHATGLHRSKIRVAFGHPISYTDRSSPSSSPHGMPPADGGGAGGRAARVTHERIAQAVTHQWQELERRLGA